MATNDPGLPGGEQIIASGRNTPVPGLPSVDGQTTQPGLTVTKPGAAPADPAVFNRPTVPQTALTTVQQGNIWGKRVPVIAVRNLTKTYILGKKTRVPALRGISLEVYPGEFVAVVGPSRSGQRPLLNLLVRLERATPGEYWRGGVPYRPA